MKGLARSGACLAIVIGAISPFAGSGRAGSAPLTDMALIPEGAFIMGGDDGPADERPPHRVELKTFSMDRTPVTNQQFAEFLNAAGPVNPNGERLYDVDDNDARIHKKGSRWLPDPGFENHPVVEVSWFGARGYCAWAGKRLPTEAEWEKAARGSDGRRFPWGNELPDASRARFRAGWNQTTPVGSFPRGASPQISAVEREIP